MEYLSTAFFSLEELNSFIKKYESDHIVSLVVRDFKSIEALKDSCPKKYSMANKDLKYSYLKYTCNKGNRHVYKGRLLNNSSKIKEECPMSIKILLSDDGQSLCVKHILDFHNHDNGIIIKKCKRDKKSPVFAKDKSLNINYVQNVNIFDVGQFPLDENSTDIDVGCTVEVATSDEPYINKRGTKAPRLLESNDIEAFNPPGFLKFNDNLKNDWLKWKQKFQIYMKASRHLYTKDEGTKIAMFLNLLGDDGINVYNKFNLENKCKTLDTLVSEFEKCIIPGYNTTYETFKFNKIVQKQGQSFDEFVKELKNQAGSCLFQCHNCQTSYEERMIKDRIVVGTSDVNLRESLLHNNDIDLNNTPNLSQALKTNQKHSTSSYSITEKT